jgi:ribonuclease BN (tRNA processing enzyme)
MLLVSHLHPDHSSDLLGLLWSGRNTRNDVLPIVEPSGNEAAPALDEFLIRLFDPKSSSIFGTMRERAEDGARQRRRREQDIPVGSSRPAPPHIRSEPRKHQAIDIAHGNPLGRPTPQHIELMPKGENFALQGCARAEQPGHGVPDQLEEIAHRRDYRPIRR